MKYEEFEARAKSAFDDCSEMKRMLWTMQTVVGAVPDMVRKNERLDRERAELRQENAALKTELDDWKGNAEGFQPDAYMRFPLDADGAAIRPGDKIYFDGDPESEALICVAIGCWPQPVEFMDWGKAGTTAWENGNVFTHHRPKPEPPDSWEKLEEDASVGAQDYCANWLGIDIRKTLTSDDDEAFANDIIRRAKKLAGIEEQDGE